MQLSLIYSINGILGATQVYNLYETGFLRCRDIVHPETKRFTVKKNRPVAVSKFDFSYTNQISIFSSIAAEDFNVCPASVFK